MRSILCTRKCGVQAFQTFFLCAHVLFVVVFVLDARLKNETLFKRQLSSRNLKVAGLSPLIWNCSEFNPDLDVNCPNSQLVSLFGNKQCCLCARKKKKKEELLLNCGYFIQKKRFLCNVSHKFSWGVRGTTSLNTLSTCDNYLSVKKTTETLL